MITSNIQIKHKNTSQNSCIRRVGEFLLDYKKIGLEILILKGVFYKIGTIHKG